MFSANNDPCGLAYRRKAALRVPQHCVGPGGISDVRGPGGKSVAEGGVAATQAMMDTCALGEMLMRDNQISRGKEMQAIGETGPHLCHRVVRFLSHPQQFRRQRAPSPIVSAHMV